MMMYIKETASAPNQIKHSGFSYYNTMVLISYIFVVSLNGLDSVAN